MWDEFGVISYLHMYFGARVTFGKRKHPNAALQVSTVVFLTKSDVRTSQGLMLEKQVSRPSRVSMLHFAGIQTFQRSWFPFTL